MSQVNEKLLTETLDRVIIKDGNSFTNSKDLFKLLKDELNFPDSMSTIGFFRCNRKTLEDYGFKAHRRRNRGYLNCKIK